MHVVTALDRVDASAEVKLQWPRGDRSDPRARIMPFKVHRGRTPYDEVHGTMVVPHLFPSGKEDQTA